MNLCHVFVLVICLTIYFHTVHCCTKTLNLGRLKDLDHAQNFQIVSSNETILAISFKEHVRSSSSFFQNKKILFFSPNSEVYTSSEERRKLLESSYKLVLEIYNISTKGSPNTKEIEVDSIQYISSLQSDCVFGSVLVDYWSPNEGPIIITTDIELPKVLRLMRANNKLGRNIQMEDLSILKLAPLYFSYVDTPIDQNCVMHVSDQYRNFTSMCEKSISTCIDEVKDPSYHTSCYLLHDYCILKSLTLSLSNSSFEQQFFNYLKLMNSKLTLYVNETLNNYSISNLKNTSFMRSEIYECSSPTCAFEPLEYEDIQGIIFVLFFVFLYFIGLLLTFKTKSMKIRLASPYSVPIVLLVRVLIQNQLFMFNCTRFYNVLSNVTVIYSIFQYVVIVVRYFYLRNLFSIISKSDHFKLYKFLASKWLGWLMSFIIPIFFASFSMLMVIDKEIYLTGYVGYFRNSPLGLVIVLSMIPGIIFLILDMIGNRRKIQKKGLYYYFFFDDPFYIKIDLVFLLLLFILTVITVLVYGSPFASGVLVIVTSLVSLVIVGGSAMSIEIYKRIVYVFFSKKIIEEINKDKSIENNLEDENLMKLLRKFAMKEFSIENVMLFETLKSFESNKKAITVPVSNSVTNSVENSISTIGSSTDSIATSDSKSIPLTKTLHISNSSSLVDQCYLSFDQASQIEELHMRTYSKFEVNFPNQTKKSFYQWFDEKKQLYTQQPTTTTSVKSIPYSELKEILLYEVIKNVSDTFSRLSETAEYKKWLKLTELQKENELYDL